MAKWMRSIVAGAVDDLVLLNTVTEEAIVSNLQNTFAKNSIYTAIGPVLLSVNPFQPIDGLYTLTRAISPLEPGPTSRQAWDPPYNQIG